LTRDVENGRGHDRPQLMRVSLGGEAFEVLTLADITGPDDYSRAPQIDGAEVRLLWHVDFWDGPRSGMLAYRGQECWYQVVAQSEDDDAGWYRRFVVLRLSPEQYAEERRWHELFRAKVGVHTDYEEQKQRPRVGFLWPREHWREFYEPYQRRTPPDFSGNEVLGWFER
jgi:hypothetical protein